MKILTQTMTAAVISIQKETNVKQKMNSLRNIVLALCVVGALMFGATQAMAYTTCLTCDWPSGHGCSGPDPDQYCNMLCLNEWSCEFGGKCDTRTYECMCYE